MQAKVAVKHSNNNQQRKFEAISSHGTAPLSDSGADLWEH